LRLKLKKEGATQEQKTLPSHAALSWGVSHIFLKRRKQRTSKRKCRVLTYDRSFLGLKNGETLPRL
jgi:hypothetical protein